MERGLWWAMILGLIALALVSLAYADGSVIERLASWLPRVE